MVALASSMSRDTLIFVLALGFSSALLVAFGPPALPRLVLLLAFFGGGWLLSLPLRDAGITDILWGLGFVVVGWFDLVSATSATPRGILVCAFATLWGLRLAVHIGVRNAGQGEDHRYAAWRDDAGRSFWWISLFKVFLLQAVILWVVSVPLLLAQLDAPTAALRPLDLIGAALWAFGLIYESIADWQLLRFKRQPDQQGRVLRSGLWSLSRHPNYFGEAVLWWGLGLLALPTGGLLALVGPALLTFLLLRVSGVALLDRTMTERRPEYADYIRSTPAFFPVPRSLRRAPSDG
jgi:steroid 5-alpha reductase family enzyme